MNIHVGSLQKKGNWFYLVLPYAGKQKWISLHTTKATEAQKRAAKLTKEPFAEECDWLKKLVEIGTWASHELHIRESTRAITGENILEHFRKAVNLPISKTSMISYQRWIEILSAHIGQKNPIELSGEDIHAVAEKLREHYSSSARILRFYARIWSTLQLPTAAKWRSEAHYASCVSVLHAHEHYRRLTTGEVRTIIRQLDDSMSTTAHEYADMIAIGFCTGLRLSDIAELEFSEVSPEGNFIHLVPNKVRNHKPVPLTIPIPSFLHKRLERRLMMRVHGAYLFDEYARKRPSNAIVRIFRACGVIPQGEGRASFHSLRATFISLMDEAGISPHITDAITGHAAGDMHARYTQPSLMSLMQAVEKAIPVVW